jgi:hypothetical protein
MFNILRALKRRQTDSQPKNVPELPDNQGNFANARADQREQAFSEIELPAANNQHEPYSETQEQAVFRLQGQPRLGPCPGRPARAGVL